MGVRAADPVFQEVMTSAQDTSANVTTIYAHPCVYYGAVVTTALSAHTVLITDGVGGTTLDTFAASATVGTKNTYPWGVRCDNGLVINPDDSSTGNITVFYRPLAGFTP